VKGNRQSIVVTNNRVDAMACIAFNIVLNSDEDANRTVVNNLGRAIVK